MPRTNYRRSASHRFALQEAEDTVAGIYGPSDHERYYLDEYSYYWTPYDPRDVWGRWPGYGSDGSSDEDDAGADGHGRVKLFRALSEGDMPAVRRLLFAAEETDDSSSNVVAPNARDGNGATALIIAARMGDSEAVDLLLSRGVRADPHLATKRGETALHAAVGREVFVAPRGNPRRQIERVSNEDIVARLVAAGANLNARRYVTILHVHRNSTWQYVSTRFAGLTALHLAVFADHVPMVRQLLASGASANIGDKIGRTPLHFVGIHGRCDAGQDTLESGYRAYLSAAAANAPFPAASSDSSPASPPPPPPQQPYCVVAREHALLLVSSGADVGWRETTSDQWTPLHVAVFEGLAEMVSTLVDVGGADVNVVDAHGRTPLYLALCKGHSRIASYLVAEGAEVLAPRYYGPERFSKMTKQAMAKWMDSSNERLVSEKAGLCRALCLAAQMGSIPTVRTLVAASKKVGVVPSRDGATCWLEGQRHVASPLQCAIIGGRSVSFGGYETGDGEWGIVPDNCSKTEWARCAFVPPRSTGSGADARRRRAGLVKGLLLAGWCPFETIWGGRSATFTESALRLASERGLVDVVRVLLAAMGPRDTWPASYADGPLALDAAVARGHAEVVEMLNAAGVHTL